MWNTLLVLVHRQSAGIAEEGTEKSGSLNGLVGGGFD